MKKYKIFFDGEFESLIYIFCCDYQLQFNIRGSNQFAIETKLFMGSQNFLFFYLKNSNIEDDLSVMSKKEYKTTYCVFCKNILFSIEQLNILSAAIHLSGKNGVIHLLNEFGLENLDEM